jgi:hypothetical protein
MVAAAPGHTITMGLDEEDGSKCYWSCFAIYSVDGKT